VKKRIVTLCLVLCMLASMLAVPVTASEGEENRTDSVALCPCGCGESLNAIAWEPWDVNATGDPAAGHYYLDGDYVQDGQKKIIAGDQVVLDLRGHTITSKGYSRLLLVYGQMFVMDTVGGGRFMSKTAGTAFGGVVMVSTNEVNDSLFQLCSGTITVDDDNKGSRRGGLIHVSQTATFRMTGGMLLNGSTVTNDGAYLEPGGCVAGAGSACTIEILGGQIVGGESATSGGNIYSEGTTILKNCRILGGIAAKSGGNVYQVGSSLTMENCVISDGVAFGTTGGGGNVCASEGAAMTIRDSALRNGYSAYHGGNLYLGKTNVTLENTEIYAGVAVNRGGNIYGTSSATGLSVTDCAFPGDVTYIGTGLKLEGRVKIGLLNNGLRLWYKNYYPAVDASGLTEGSEIYVDANQTITGADTAYFKGAMRCVLSESEEGLVGTQAADGELGGCCPHCGERVVWNAFSTTASLVQNCLLDSADDTDPACTGRHVESGHYYLTASITNFTQHYVGIYQGGVKDADDVVLDLAGYSLTSSGRIFYIRAGNAASGIPVSSLTLLDSFGGGMATGKGAKNQGGGVIYNDGGELTIYGGKYVYNFVSDRNTAGGGVVINSGTFNLHGGCLDGSAFTYTDMSTTDKTYTYRGGAVSSLNGVKHVNITAGRLVGGTAQLGGCVFFGYNNVVNITGGQFDSGITNVGGGGNIHMYGNSSNTGAVFRMSGASVRNGRVEVTGAAGGNLYLQYGNIGIADSYIEGGYSAAYGGNIFTGSTSTIHFKDCIIEGGYAAAQSGNVHISATSTTSTWENCRFLNGSGTYGGNVHSGNGYTTFKGGQFLFGTARTSYGGNLCAISGNNTATNYTKLLADENGNTPLIAGGSAKTYGGNLYVGGVAQLQAARLVNGKAGTVGQDLYVAKGSKNSKLTLGDGVTGRWTVAFAASLLGTEVYGQAIDRTACDTLNATLILDGNYNDAVLCTKDGALFVGAIAVTDGTSYKWFTDTASAVAACDENSYVKLFIAQDVELTKDCAVDICGQTVNISGAYTLYGMDSSGDGYTTPTGKAVLSDETKLANDVTIGGKRYVATSDDTAATFHRLENRISGVALRPSTDGIYFTGAFGCDETLSSNIDSYGVAVSTVNMPGENFMTDEDTLYTNFDAATLEGGANVNGVLISGILKDSRSDTLNSAYGKMPVFATAYMVMKDGSVILSDNTADQNDDVAYSLYDVMADIDSKIIDDPIGYRKYTNAMRAFYEKWEEMGMKDWAFNRINTPADDGVVDILMIGHSLCYYYVEELYGMLSSAGIKANVCNVYYSGCSIEQHWNWWKNGDANYQFFITNENGRVKTSGVSLEWCLAQREWDVISLEESPSKYSAEDPMAEMEISRMWRTELWDYLKEQFPDSRYFWQQSWSRQVGDKYYVMESKEKQQYIADQHKTVDTLICKELDLERVCSGDAWQIVRNEYGYDNLCARIGKGDNHEGDNGHDGDWGGGQYLNACVWYEIITGDSCVGNTYRPVYMYEGEEIPLDSNITYEKLQEAAHKAVAQMRAENEQA